ncbi:catalytic activity [Nesidiocoris tenuis]|uniref:Catalytic activity n=1 Tax=Nesidiocoris tenuis TaxID=355587 RepID=A0ABN7B031_9HEMI|nr:catalytic activity [Nesidiocoris tenuis]
MFGFKIGAQKRPIIRIIVFLSFAAFVTTFYILGTLSDGYYFLIRETESIDPADRTSFFEYLNSSNLAEKAGYLVYSPSCRIPDIPPFHESIKKLYAKQAPISCGNLPPLTSVVRGERATHILRLHKGLFHRYHNGAPPTCCYNLIARKDQSKSAKNLSRADDTFGYSKCIRLDDNVTFSGDEEFVRVKCNARDKNKKLYNIYTNMHAFVGIKPKVKEKMQSASNGTSAEKMSVMIIGIDSISRLNLIRTMPLTFRHLQRNGWFTLKGYNKIDDNTFPNLVAILAGMTYAQIRDACFFSPRTPVDDCPLLWKNFSSRGYITAYAEDEPVISTFNYHKTGFVQSPTDYYLRPFMLAAEKSTKLKIHASLNICLGPVLAADHILNYLVDFATTFNQYPTFSLFWLNGFSHNDLNTPTTMDANIEAFLDRLSASGALNSTMVIFLSDHGMRFGKIRETYIGYVEERLPFIYFWLPEKFKNAFPSKVNNLVLNSNRLTSPYDVHMTLLDVLGSKRNGTDGCSTCRTLFDAIPWNRSCADAGITEHWCTCAEYKTLSTEAAPVRVIAEFVVTEINEILKNYTTYVDQGTHCAVLKAKRVLSMRSKIFSKESGYEEYVMLLQTVPGDALFEVTISHTFQFKIMDSISRINSYSTQSRCMKDAYAKKYCYCETDHHNVTTTRTTFATKTSS